MINVGKEITLRSKSMIGLRETHPDHDQLRSGLRLYLHPHAQNSFISKAFSSIFCASGGGNLYVFIRLLIVAEWPSG